MSVSARKLTTYAEYLAQEEVAVVKHAYLRGELFAGVELDPAPRPSLR